MVLVIHLTHDYISRIPVLPLLHEAFGVAHPFLEEHLEGYRYYVNELRDSPTVVQIASSVISAENSLSVGSGLTTGEAGHPLVFQIILADVFGNRCDGLDVFLPALSKAHSSAAVPRLIERHDFLNIKANATLRTPMRETSQGRVVPVSLTLDFANGIVRAEGYPTVSGIYDLDVTYRANHSYDDPATAMVPHERIYRSPFDVSMLCPCHIRDIITLSPIG